MTRPARQPVSSDALRPHHPVDQAQGRRQMFASRVLRFIPVVANPRSGCGGLVLERLCAAYANFGLHTLVVDASDQARAPSELVAFDLSEGIEKLSDHVSYMPARGLPLTYVDARGSCGGLLDALADASPQSDTILIHASASELVRLFGQRARAHGLRPLVFTNDMAEGLTDAYAAVKILSQRGGWMSYDLLVCATPDSTQAEAVSQRLARCADDFLGVAQRSAQMLDPREASVTDPSARFMELAAALLHSALPLTLGDSAFDNLMSPGAALPARVASALN
ncbi:flagellar biosynthesis protein [Aquabacterium sp.]|uniref:flagellar biosynthesis protein n=1 Tax=Aquabacterium sp. TaxID=1872578 RepID=UPI003B752E6F